MAVSDGTLFILVAQLGTYALLFTNKIRLYRIIGAFAIILIGLSAVMVEDTVPAFIFAGISLIIGGMKVFTEVTSLTK